MGPASRTYIPRGLKGSCLLVALRSAFSVGGASAPPTAIYVPMDLGNRQSTYIVGNLRRDLDV
jgi:hypothetical protein